MANETGRWANLREVRHPDVRGWTVVGADGRKIGQVRSLLADPHDDESRFFAVELDQTALQQDLVTPGGEQRITAGASPPDPTAPAPGPRPTSIPRWARASGRRNSTPAPASTRRASPAPSRGPTTAARGAPGGSSPCTS